MKKINPLSATIVSLLLLAFAAANVGAACSQDGTFNIPAWPANPAEDNVSFYRVYRAAGDANGTYAEIGTTATPGYTDTVTEPGRYFYQLAAVTVCEGEEIESELSAASEAYIYTRRPATPTW